MSDSAVLTPGAPWSDKRVRTARRIAACAQRLTDERGVDGFTMDDLAEAADVSRRTLFNYFPGKDDAILGPMPELDPAVVATFREGGPSGHLMDDMATIVQQLLRDKDMARDEIALTRRVMDANPRLKALALHRFHDFCETFMGVVQDREGQRFDKQRATIGVAVLGAVMAVTMESYLADPGGPDLADRYTASLRTARELLL